MNKLAIMFLVAMPVSAILEFINKYLYHDTDYLIFLGVLIALDTILGFCKHWITGDVSSQGFADFGKKILLYASVLILSNVLMHFTINGAAPIYTSWFGTFSCTMLMVRESISIVENIEAIRPGFFPLWVIKRLKDFDSNTGNKL